MAAVVPSSATVRWPRPSRSTAISSPRSAILATTGRTAACCALARCTTSASGRNTCLGSSTRCCATPTGGLASARTRVAPGSVPWATRPAPTPCSHWPARSPRYSASWRTAWAMGRGSHLLRGWRQTSSAGTLQPCGPGATHFRPCRHSRARRGCAGSAGSGLQRRVAGPDAGSRGRLRGRTGSLFGVALPRAVDRQESAGVEHQRVANASHFAFMDTPTRPIPTEDGDIGTDPPGFDRQAFLSRLRSELISLFERAFR